MIAVDTRHHPIVADDVTGRGHDRARSRRWARQASRAIGADSLTALADRGDCNSEQTLGCEQSGIAAWVPKPPTSDSKAAKRFGERDFPCVAQSDECRCAAGERAIRRFTMVRNGRNT